MMSLDRGLTLLFTMQVPDKIDYTLVVILPTTKP